MNVSLVCGYKPPSSRQARRFARRQALVDTPTVDSTGRILSVRQTSACKYVIELESPIGCIDAMTRECAPLEGAALEPIRVRFNFSQYFDARP